MPLIQLLRVQKAHNQNRQLMRFVMMSLLSCARAVIFMFQTVKSWIGPSCFSRRCLQNLSGGLGIADPRILSWGTETETASD